MEDWSNAELTQTEGSGRSPPKSAKLLSWDAAPPPELDLEADATEDIGLAQPAGRVVDKETRLDRRRAAQFDRLPADTILIDPVFGWSVAIVSDAEPPRSLWIRQANGARDRRDVTREIRARYRLAMPATAGALVPGLLSNHERIEALAQAERLAREVPDLVGA